MAIKLGELLVQEGMVSQEDVEEALKYQVIYGGKLGTNLIEMGLVEMGDIAKMLSKKLRVPYVPPEKLDDIPQPVLDLIPKEIAVKFSAVPISLEGRKLTLAMADPTDLMAIDEISFRTGVIVVPVLTPEIRLILALERYYGFEREVRYIALEKTLKPRRKKKPAKPAPATKPAAQPQEAAAPEAMQPEPLEALAHNGNRGAMGPVEEIDIPLDEDIEELAAVEVEEEIEELEELEEIEGLEEIEELEEPVVMEEYTMDLVSQLLAEAEDREDIADTLIGYMGQEFDRGALFQIRGKVASGWRGVANRQIAEHFSEFKLSLEEHSVVKTVVDSRSYYLGAIARSEANDRMFQSLGGYMAPTALLVPVLVQGRPIALFYVDSKGGDLSERTIDLQRIAGKASMAFEILILKNKILML